MRSRDRSTLTYGVSANGLVADHGRYGHLQAAEASGDSRSHRERLEFTKRKPSPARSRSIIEISLFCVDAEGRLLNPSPIASQRASTCSASASWKTQAPRAPLTPFSHKEMLDCDVSIIAASCSCERPTCSRELFSLLPKARLAKSFIFHRHLARPLCAFEQSIQIPQFA